MDCKEFRGTVMRSEGGCRIYVPNATIAASVENATIAAAVENVTIAAVVENATDALGSTLETAEMSMADTTDAAPTASTMLLVCVANMMMTGSDVSTMLVVDKVHVPKLIPKKKVEIPAGVISVVSRYTPTVVRCSIPVIKFLMARPVEPVPIVSSLPSDEGLNAAVQVLPVRQADATVTDVDMMPRVLMNLGTWVNVVSTGDRWGRDAQMVEGLFQIMEGMETPWITLSILEAAVLRFPLIERETLRLIIMTMMMTQRRCVVRLTRAGLRRGPRVDRDGNAFVELDLDYADCYSTSH